MFAIASPFQSSLALAGKAGAYQSGARIGLQPKGNLLRYAINGGRKRFYETARQILVEFSTFVIALPLLSFLRKKEKE